MPEPSRPIAHPRQRTTLAASATLQGKGLFTGEPATITFKSGLDGLVVLRTDKRRAIPVRTVSLHKDPIHPAFKDQKPRSTNLSNTHVVAATVEHALSALAGLGITDCTIELEGPEVPILDGSSKPFVDAILAAGLTTLPGGIAPFTLTDPIVVQDEEAGASITAQPRTTPGCSITYELDYGDDAPIPAQRATWDGSPDTYARHIAPARTFCTQAEAQALQAAGLFQDLTPADMLVIGPGGPIDNAYRMESEPAAHKLLDAIGDFTLAIRPIQADIVCCKSGHALNHRFAQWICMRFHALTTPARP